MGNDVLSNTLVKKRVVGIDYLKALSIIMIILFHYIWNSGFDISAFTGPQRVVIDIFYMFGEVGVNCFALCTGYLSVRKTSLKGHGKKVFSFWLKVLYYSIVLSVIVYLFVSPFDIDATKIKSILMPISSGTWWYTSAYFLILLVLPLITKLFLTLSEKESRWLIGSLLVYFCVVATIVGVFVNDTEKIYGYNRLILLLIMVFIGEYWALHSDKFKKLNGKKFWIWVLVGIWILLLCYFIVLEKWPMIFNGQINARYFWPPNSIPSVLIAIALFVIFINLKCKPLKVISIISASTLGIYQVHGGFSSKIWWKNIFHVNVVPGTWGFLLEMLEAVVVIIICGIVMEYIWKGITFLFDLIIGKNKKKA